MSEFLLLHTLEPTITAFRGSNNYSASLLQDVSVNSKNYKKAEYGCNQLQTLKELGVKK
jgi:hypothetical protein